MKKLMKTNSYLDRFSKALNVGIDSLTKAAFIYVEAIDSDPELKYEFYDKFRGTIPEGAWAGFEAVGRKWMHPQLLMGTGGRHANKIKKLAYSDQERVFNGEKFDLLVGGGDSIRVDLRHTSTDQARQLFNGNSIRSLQSQRVFIAEVARLGAVTDKILEESRQMPYVIKGNKVMFREGVELTKKEMTRLLESMK